nr:phage portal protein [Tessaracoccus coleopterorum]
MAVPAAYRALSVLNTSVIQLTIDVTRNGRPVAVTPSLARRPAQHMRLDQWLSQVVLDLATDGNAYLRKVGIGGSVIDLPILPASEVQVHQDTRTGVITYHHGRTEYAAEEVEHLYLIKLSTWTKGSPHRGGPARNPVRRRRRRLLRRMVERLRPAVRHPLVRPIPHRRQGPPVPQHLERPRR